MSSRSCRWLMFAAGLALACRPAPDASRHPQAMGARDLALVGVPRPSRPIFPMDSRRWLVRTELVGRASAWRILRIAHVDTLWLALAAPPDADGTRRIVDVVRFAESRHVQVLTQACVLGDAEASRVDSRLVVVATPSRDQWVTRALAQWRADTIRQRWQVVPRRQAPTGVRCRNPRV